MICYELNSKFLNLMFMYNIFFNNCKYIKIKEEYKIWGTYTKLNKNLQEQPYEVNKKN